MRGHGAPCGLEDFKHAHPLTNPDQPPSQPTAKHLTPLIPGSSNPRVEEQRCYLGFAVRRYGFFSVQLAQSLKCSISISKLCTDANGFSEYLKVTAQFIRSGVLQNIYEHVISYLLYSLNALSLEIKLKKGTYCSPEAQSKK